MSAAAPSKVIYQNERWHMRLANAADNARLCELFREVDMSAELCLAEERDPDFFALARAQGGRHYTVLLEDVQRPEAPAFGCISILARDGWVQGQVRRIGYGCDLRIEKGFRGGQVFPIALEKFMEFMRQREGIEAMYSAVLSSNQRGRNALLHHEGLRRNQPRGQVMTAYNMTSIQFTGARMARSLRPDRLRVQRASEADKSDLVAFLAERQRQRLFGYVVDEAWLDARFAQWPGFALTDFFLLKNHQGEILACAAPWDHETQVRRSRVLAYQGKMKALKLAYNLEARLRGFLPLPAPGECFHFAYLTHLEVQGDDPALLNRLLRGIYLALKRSPLHFMSLMLPVGSPLESGLQGFRLQRIPMELIAFTTPESPWHGQSLASLQPGFEMALH